MSIDDKLRNVCVFACVQETSFRASEAHRSVAHDHNKVDLCMCVCAVATEAAADIALKESRAHIANETEREE